jgi:hypothetical protein
MQSKILQDDNQSDKFDKSVKFSWKLLIGEAYCQAMCTVNRTSEDGYKK